MLSNIIDKISHDLAKELQTQRELLKVEGHLIYSDKVRIQYASMTRQLVYKSLASIFGEELNNTDDKGKFAEILTYDSKVNRFQDAALFFYLTSSRKKKNADLGDANKPAPDFFSKGRRWSNEILKKRFYHYFNRLKNAVGKDCSPLNYWVSRQPFQQLQIISTEKKPVGSRGKLSLTAYTDSNHADFLCCPDKENCAYKQLIDLILLLKHENQLTDFNGEIVKVEELTEKFNTAWSHVVKEPKHRLMVENWLWAFKKAGLRDIPTNFNNAREIFNIVCLYQYYDIPYKIHTFKFPFTASATSPACLALSYASKPKKHLSLKTCKSLAQYVKVLQQLPAIDAQIDALHKGNEGIRYRWGNYYSNEVSDSDSPYSKLQQRAVTFLQDRLSELGITQRCLPLNVYGGRIKKFESFFSRLNERANPKSEFYNGGVWNGATNAIKKEEASKYAKWIEKCNYSEVIEQFHDIVGVRVVCLFQKDVDQILKSIQQSPLVECNGVKGQNDEMKDSGYRSAHVIITLKPGAMSGSMELFTELKGLKCEVQIRSILAHAWSDVDHDIKYKNQLPKNLLESHEGLVIENSLKGAAYSLKEQDRHFNETHYHYERLVERYMDNLKMRSVNKEGAKS